MTYPPSRRHQRPSALPTGSTGRASHSEPTQVLRLPADGRQRVAGEHFYQPALQQICLGKNVPTAGDSGCWEASLPVTARLVAEHNNPHDQTAVRVEVDGATVSHLPRDDAALVHKHLAALQDAGKHAECEGRVIIASNREYSIYLHLADSRMVIGALQHQIKPEIGRRWAADAKLPL
jgi:hypothetical protein